MKRVFVFYLIMLFANLEAQAEHRASPPVRPPSQEASFTAALDIAIHFSDTDFSHCQGTLAAKNRLSEFSSLCRVAILTAAHCVDEAFEFLEIPDIGKVLEKDIQVCFAPRYQLNRLQVLGGREAGKADSATLIFETPCENLAGKEPPALAPVDSAGKTEMNANKVLLQKRQSRAGHNPGGGRQIPADVLDISKGAYRFSVPSPVGDVVVGGDSGGAVLNERGQLVCPLAASTYEGMRNRKQLKLPEPDGVNQLPADPFEVTCDGRAISKLKEYFSLYGLSSDPTQMVRESKESALRSHCSQGSSRQNKGAQPR